MERAASSLRREGSSSTCTCNTTTLSSLTGLSTTTTTTTTNDNSILQCIGQGGNNKPLPDHGAGNLPRCFRALRNFYRALIAEGVAVVPQWGTYLRWYRDCEMFNKDDHDLGK